MQSVYKYSEVKIIHFDIDKNNIEIEDYLNTNKLPLIHSEILPKYFLYDMLDDPHECRLEVRVTFRVFDKEDKISFGSYVSEQFFYIKYVNDDHTKDQIKHLFRNALFASEQTLEKLINMHNLPKGIKFSYYEFPDSVIEDVFRILKEKVQQT